LVLQHRRYGEIRRLLRLPEGVPKRIQQAPQDDAQDPSQPEPSA
jgi:general secretion pathway protein J